MEEAEEAEETVDFAMNQTPLEGKRCYLPSSRTRNSMPAVTGRLCSRAPATGHGHSLRRRVAAMAYLREPGIAGAPQARCSMLYALCSMPYALCPLPASRTGNSCHRQPGIAGAPHACKSHRGKRIPIGIMQRRLCRLRTED
jgi:hypothetical protein